MTSIIVAYKSRPSVRITWVRWIPAAGLTWNQHIRLHRNIAHTYLANPIMGRELLEHELTHVLQFQRMGTLRFLWWYITSWIMGGFRWGRIQAELEAIRTAAGRDLEEWATVCYRASLTLLA